MNFDLIWGWGTIGNLNTDETFMKDPCSLGNGHFPNFSSKTAQNSPIKKLVYTGQIFWDFAWWANKTSFQTSFVMHRWVILPNILCPNQWKYVILGSIRQPLQYFEHWLGMVLWQILDIRKVLLWLDGLFYPTFEPKTT